MTALNKQALREAAEKAGKDKWQAKKINGDFYVIRSGSYIKQCGITSYQPIAEIDHKPVRDFVAMVNPATTLALLDENLQLQREKDATEAVALALRDDMRQAREQLEAAEKRNAEQREYYEGVIADGSKRIAELERSETQLISERDDAESALNDAYKAVMGQPPEWSNWFSFENAIDEIELACELWRNQTDDVIQFRQRIAEQSAIVAAAEKLVRCKGRYHSELNYRALAKLFGVVTPDLPPLEHENVHYADAAEVEITALRQRIAELEARAVNLPKRSVDEVMHLSGFSRDYAEGWCAGNDNAIHEIRTAGIKVKGE
ncbi:ead/Ea22-like family protein [Salmonella enterica]|uniref:Protein Ead n=1 Tax=Salmonella enterica TaxID=28901 RepID=A0A633IK97_SALER|nr:protein Ead [Salmonella enterica]EBR9960354.1 protein Ead [Salmonella enterica subsp. enterica serovar Muenchen]ECE0523214.1 protein Ead [Salmonella enterica subsp. enterica]EDT4590691.1 ead/Ea22-like family protein [Salmonella enterica subsp. enterica serovar 9,12:l,z28:-]EDW4994200.1 ead/Ea22-like family protein [Salmonella enterica subsp. enterica serovar Sandiego]EEE1716391.1 ead/Ea22-like family protein [Salmonella enterica subsp. enterica serovar Javiana]